MVGVFIPWELANATNQAFFFLNRELIVKHLAANTTLGRGSIEGQVSELGG